MKMVNNTFIYFTLVKISQDIHTSLKSNLKNRIRTKISFKMCSNVENIVEYNFKDYMKISNRMEFTYTIAK